MGDLSYGGLRKMQNSTLLINATAALASDNSTRGPLEIDTSKYQMALLNAYTIPVKFNRGVLILIGTLL
jgi:hypothetical protein